MITQIFLLIVGFILLIKGASWFVDGASSIAAHFGIPQMVIGLTVVAFGTSAPEAAVSLAAGLKGSTGIAVGNVLGSNILNVLIILGITSCISKLAIKKDTLKYEMPFMIVITVVLTLMGRFSGQLGIVHGIVLWVFFIEFLIYTAKMAKKGQQELESAAEVTKTAETETAAGETAAEDNKTAGLLKPVTYTALGLVAIILGSDVAVDSASAIAEYFGLSQRLIGLTIVALGTSLPELFTSVTAAIKGNNDIAVGNIVGSNIFNILFILGTVSLISPLEFAANFVIDGWVAAAAAVLLLLLSIGKQQLGRIAGIVMLACYSGYFAFLISQ